MTFQEFCSNLETKIINSYEEGVTLDQAERLAGEFLAALMRVSAELKKEDLDARMKKSGLKAIRAAAYAGQSAPNPETGKKLTEAAIAALVDMDDQVAESQEDFDKAEVSHDDLLRQYSIFKEAHIFFRGVSKGRFE